MPEYKAVVRLTGVVEMTVEADDVAAAWDLAKESAEIGDVSSWVPEVLEIGVDW